MVCLYDFMLTWKIYILTLCVNLSEPFFCIFLVWHNLDCLSVINEILFKFVNVTPYCLVSKNDPLTRSYLVVKGGKWELKFCWTCFFWNQWYQNIWGKHQSNVTCFYFRNLKEKLGIYNKVYFKRKVDHSDQHILNR